MVGVVKLVAVVHRDATAVNTILEFFIGVHIAIIYVPIVTNILLVVTSHDIAVDLIFVVEGVTICDV